MPLKYIELEEGEKYINEEIGCVMSDSKTSTLTYDYVINKENFENVMFGIRNGKLFFTNKRIIFESRVKKIWGSPDKTTYSFPYGQISYTEGNNGGLGQPGRALISSGLLEIYFLNSTTPAYFDQCGYGKDLSEKLNREITVLIQNRIDEKSAKEAKEATKIAEKMAKEYERLLDYNKAIETYKLIPLPNEVIRVTGLLANDKEEHLDYDLAITLYEEIGDKVSAKRVRKLKAEMGAVKVTQKVVHGDEVTKTEIKDSVVSKSNIGSGRDDKVAKLEKIANLKREGLIDDDEFKQMKKEILGK